MNHQQQVQVQSFERRVMEARHLYGVALERYNKANNESDEPKSWEYIVFKAVETLHANGYTKPEIFRAIGTVRTDQGVAVSG